MEFNSAGEYTSEDSSSSSVSMDNLQSLIITGRRKIEIISKNMEVLVRSNGYERALYKSPFTSDVYQSLMVENHMHKGGDKHFDQHELEFTETKIWKRKVEQVLHESRTLYLDNKRLRKSYHEVQQELATRNSIGEDQKIESVLYNSADIWDSIQCERQALRKIIADLPQTVIDHITTSYVPRSMFETKHQELHAAYTKLLSNRVKDKGIPSEDTCIKPKVRRNVIGSEFHLARCRDNRFHHFNEITDISIETIQKQLSLENTLTSSLSNALKASEDANEKLLAVIELTHRPLTERVLDSVVTPNSVSLTVLGRIKSSTEHSDDQRGVQFPQEFLKYSATCSVCGLPPFGAMYACGRCTSSIHMTCSGDAYLGFPISNFLCAKCVR